MYPNKVSKIFNMGNPLVIFVCSYGKGLTCSLREFYHANVSVLPLLRPGQTMKSTAACFLSKAVTGNSRRRSRNRRMEGNLGPRHPETFQSLCPSLIPAYSPPSSSFFPENPSGSLFNMIGMFTDHLDGPRHDWAARVRSIDILNHKGQGLRFVGHIVLFQRRRQVLQRTLAFPRVLYRQPSFMVYWR
jgi:hypothetical protein